MALEENWRSIAEQVSREMGFRKLTVLVARFCRPFEIEDEKEPGKAMLETAA